MDFPYINSIEPIVSSLDYIFGQQPQVERCLLPIFVLLLLITPPAANVTPVTVVDDDHTDYMIIIENHAF